MKYDILVTSYNRPDYLRKTIQRILQATTSKYSLHIADGGSNIETKEAIWNMYSHNLIDGLLFAPHRGVRPTLNIGTWLTMSDPIIYADDDVLCPILTPDWLSRLTAEFQRHPELAMLALRHPGAKNKPVGKSDRVVYCKSLGAMFVAIRRRFLLENPFPHEISSGKPMEWRCQRALDTGWKIGYLRDVYCYHFGEKSALTGKDYKGKFIEPDNWGTLEVQ